MPSKIARHTYIVLALSSVFMWSGTYASYGCTIEEIVEMALDGSGKDAIKSACDGVDDAPRCSFNKVLNYAMADKDEYYIEERCGLCEQAQCNTSFGWCPMDPSSVVSGGSCTCFNPMNGFVAQGVAKCD